MYLRQYVQDFNIPACSGFCYGEVSDLYKETIKIIISLETELEAKRQSLVNVLMYWCHKGNNCLPTYRSHCEVGI